MFIHVSAWRIVACYQHVTVLTTFTSSAVSEGCVCRTVSGLIYQQSAIKLLDEEAFNLRQKKRHKYKARQ